MFATCFARGFSVSCRRVTRGVEQFCHGRSLGRFRWRGTGFGRRAGRGTGRSMARTCAVVSRVRLATVARGSPSWSRARVWRRRCLLLVDRGDAFFRLAADRLGLVLGGGSGLVGLLAGVEVVGDDLAQGLFPPAIASCRGEHGENPARRRADSAMARRAEQFHRRSRARMCSGLGGECTDGPGCACARPCQHDSVPIYRDVVIGLATLGSR